MTSEITGRLSAFHIFEGLQDGLSRFSGPSRVAIVYALTPDEPMRIYDPQKLLRGHEPKLEEIYLKSDDWRKHQQHTRLMSRYTQPLLQPDLQLAGLISTGGCSRSMFYQMWFTEHHPDMCSTGPTERWLEYAVWLLSQDIGRDDADYTGASGYVIREYGPHAVRDYIVDELNRRYGMDIQLRVYAILDAVLGVSETREEGAWPRGGLLFVDHKSEADLNLMARFPTYEAPDLTNTKHVRKLLQAVEKSERKLVSDGKTIIGIAAGSLPETRLSARFQGHYGFLRIEEETVCSFSDGKVYSFTRRAKLVQLEEFLLDAAIDELDRADLFKIISTLVHRAEAEKFGCTLVVDMGDPVLDIAGQHFSTPLDLREDRYFELANSLAKMDGALHIAKDLRLHGFACILDGHTVSGEDRSRGARLNSALRFAAEHRDVAIVVVSADRPVSVIQEGVELSARCFWEPLSARLPTPPLLKDWIKG